MFKRVALFVGTNVAVLALIAIVSDISGNQRLGITPIAALFLIGLILLLWVKPEGDQGKWSDAS